MREFEQFWTVYPKRRGDRNKSGARIVFQKIVARGVDPQKIIAGAQKYSRFHEPNSQFIPMASTWLNRQGWVDHDEQEQSPISADEAARLIEKYRQRRLREGWS